MLTDTDPAAPQVVLIGEGDNVPQALLDAANNVELSNATRPEKHLAPTSLWHPQKRWVALPRLIPFRPGRVQKSKSAADRSPMVLQVG